ncbi:hypothetical protein OZ410_12325 [Robiginitalea sp. M366]|uniref:hypothetical protein n=1 Tax=Robiginitalea aestuariiviva TaxID=3036903 RepID=UPI00240D5CD9|nr:hypothetical protein [Robiginitalea aestuariiviva]MDG1573107.1 hypothetical protein [Robiginitalea aestuariiviva]
MMTWNYPFDLTREIQTRAFIQGVDAFEKGLERLFFASVQIQRSTPENGKEQLVLELKCPLPFVEALYHFRQGTWGGSLAGPDVQVHPPSVSTLIEDLNLCNEEALNLSEILLEFTDLTLVIQHSGAQPLDRMLPLLFENLSREYVSISHGSQALPNEIYIPVQADETTGYLAEHPDGKSPYRYWGLYFENEIEGKVYDSHIGDWNAPGIDLLPPPGLGL